MRLATTILATLLVAAPGVAAAAERRPVTYLAPVDGPITDPFRPPSTPYGAGNRGVDYRTRDGERVRAAAAGDVVFAGQVGGSLHVVVLHADGIRTSYSFLRSVAVVRGNRVDAGATVGTAATSLHFGARAGDAYIDPAVLLAGRVSVHLIADGTAARARPESESAEGAGVAKLVWGGMASGGARLASASWYVARAATPIDDVHDALAGLRMPDGIRPHLPGEGAIRVAFDVARQSIAREPCTAVEAPAPTPDQRGHVVVLVGGMGASSENASVHDVDTDALGYALGDVVQFSYRGGTTAENRYDAADTLTDLRRSGRRLRELLDRLQYERPGVTVDVIAHSQGGLITRSALGDELDPFDPRAPRVGTVITLATPHHGADLATAAALLRHTTRGPLIESVVGRAGRRHGVDPTAKSVHQLAETSDYIRKLNRRPLPSSVRAVSIAGRRDVVVPTPRSHLRGAHNVIVTIPGIGNDHSRLPGSAAAQREMALALSGQPPTCETAADRATDALTGHAISAAERGAGVGAAAASEGGP